MPKRVACSRRLVPPALPPPAACSVCAAPLTGAVAGTGGWLLCAPGTPAAVVLPGWLLSSLRCSRTAGLASPPWLGL